MSEFDYQPAYGATVQKQPRVQAARFGDGYEQRVADGINTMPQRWSMTFSAITATIDAIEAFLVSKAGATAFTWTPSGFSEIKVVCREWSRGINSRDASALSCTFEQVFE